MTSTVSYYKKGKCSTASEILNEKALYIPRAIQRTVIFFSFVRFLPSIPIFHYAQRHHSHRVTVIFLCLIVSLTIKKSLDLFFSSIPSNVWFNFLFSVYIQIKSDLHILGESNKLCLKHNDNTISFGYRKVCAEDVIMEEK